MHKEIIPIKDIDHFLDDEQYPSDEFIDAIAHCKPEDYNFMLEKIEQHWRFANYFTKKKDEEGVIRIEMITGGWSGNESIIKALRKNSAWWACFWELSTRGGRHCFEIYE